MDERGRPDVCVCIATRRRNELLRRLLRTVAAQETGGRFRVSAVVVENDTAGRAAPVVDAVREETGLPIAYALQPVKNIALTRNAALALADGDFAAMIDDDEYAPPGWLLRLHAALDGGGADIAVGPLIPEFAPSTPRWVARTRFHEQARPRRGSTTGYPGSTSNCLLSLSAVRRAGLRFDPAFGITGGEDSDFFQRATRLGLRFRWVEDAPVRERVPADRCTLRYMSREAFSTGLGYMRLRLRLGGRAWRAYNVGLSAGKLGVMSLLTALSLPLSPARPDIPARAFLKLCGLAGQLKAHAGRPYALYRDPEVSG